MEALVVLDVQNEFSPQGGRPVPNHGVALDVIRMHIASARHEGRPIVFVRHHNKPMEDPVFQPGTWGAEFSPGIGPVDRPQEAEFIKDVFGAFTGTDLAGWLGRVGADAVLLVGFFAHMCVSTTAREGVMLGLTVAVDRDGTGGYPLEHELLGTQSADEVARTALLQLSQMGVKVISSAVVA
jgi:nicotinamidase-related amidase